MSFAPKHRPKICSMCLGEATALRFTRDNPIEDCQMCNLPFTVVQWNSTCDDIRKTQFCSSCSKQGSFCQSCGQVYSNIKKRNHARPTNVRVYPGQNTYPAFNIQDYLRLKKPSSREKSPFAAPMVLQPLVRGEMANLVVTCHYPKKTEG